MELMVENDDSKEERVNNHKKKSHLDASEKLTAGFVYYDEFLILIFVL
jgi:hypothetical protein